MSEASKRQKLDNGDELWRKSSPDFLHLLRTMFKEKVYTDVTVRVECGTKSKEIECHSLILMAHSPVLSALLSPKWKEVSSERKIILKDDDPDHFEYFVGMMYMDWKDEYHENYDDVIPDALTPEIAVGVLSLAHKYLASYVILQAEHLILCYLYNRSPVETVKIFILLGGLKIRELDDIDDKARKLLWTVKNCILADGEKVFSSDAVLIFNQLGLLDILKEDYLQCSESAVYNGCIKWGQEQCKLRKLTATGKHLRSVLGDRIIRSIRFPLLNKLMITKVVRQAKVLTDGEMIELLAYFVNKDLLPKKENPIRFCCEPRTSSQWLRVNRLELDCVPPKLADFSTAHGFKITMSEKVTLCGLMFYGGPSTSKNYNYKVEIQNCIFRQEVKDDGKPVYVNIEPNFVIEANIPITIKFTITGGSTYVYPHIVEEATTEITHWGNKTVISKFNVCPDIPNGLRQVPFLMFAANTESNVDIDSPDSSDSE